MELQKTIFSGYWGKNHCQGIAYDEKNKCVYYSFTTKLVKTDISGNVIGTVENITGHLGCISFDKKDGKVYASLEYKNDAIGKGILASLGITGENADDAFYIAIFDVEKIDRIGLDAEKDGIMRAICLKTVVDDYKGQVTVNGKTVDHVHGCSGIDGLAIGPDFGGSDKNYLHVCYGVYNDVNRDDNDYQVVLQYDHSSWWNEAKPLNQHAMHRVGPAQPRNKYFFFTGNTNWGVQNFEYDAYTNSYFAFVYTGYKPQYPNYSTFVVDASISAKESHLAGYDDGTVGKVLTLKKVGEEKSGVNGIFFDGSTGAYSFGDGKFYISKHGYDEQKGGQFTTVTLYELNNSKDVWEFIEK
jgi:hypothetical protein